MTEQPAQATVSIPRPWLDLLKSALRTAAAPLVGFLVAWLQARGVVVPDWGGPYLVPVVVSVGYYLAARLAEVKIDARWGLLLLAVGKPVYETASEALNTATVPVLAEVPVGSPPPYSGPWPPAGA
jgi:hypothetical protein